MEKKLISLVKEHDYLYNRRANYYKDLARKEEKWQEIAAELGIEVKKTKQRWKSLRDRFSREYGKMKATGQETKDVNWKYFDALFFLKDCTEPRDRSSTVMATTLDNKINNLKAEVNAKNINELFSTFLSENEDSGQGTASANRAQENSIISTLPILPSVTVSSGNTSFVKNLPVVYKIERGNELTQSNATTLNTNEEQHHKDPLLISFDNTTLTAAAAAATASVTTPKHDTNRYIHTSGTGNVNSTAISTFHATPFTTTTTQMQNDTFIRSFFNAMAMQIEHANLNFQAWATIQQEIMEVVNRNIIQYIQQMQQNTNRLNIATTQTQTNGTS